MDVLRPVSSFRTDANTNEKLASIGISAITLARMYSRLK
jgi:hypothetical protein